MKRILALILSVFLCFSTSVLIVSAAETEADHSVMSLMPISFVFSDTINLATGTDFPPGYAEYDVRIAGVVDGQRNIVMSIDSRSCWYRGGVNCTVHDMSVEAWKDVNSPNTVFWKLTGTLGFSWVSPVTGLQYEKVFYESPTYSFVAYNYT